MVTGTYTAPNNAAHLTVDATSNVGGTFWFDDVSLINSH